MNQNFELFIRKMIVEMYLTLQEWGCCEVSLKTEDLLTYVPKLKKLLEEYGLLISDLFIRTTVSKNCDEYRNFLIQELYGGKLGYFSDRYDAIILKHPKIYRNKWQKEMEDFQKVIQEGCCLIANAIGFIDADFDLEGLCQTQLKNKQKILRR